MKKRVLFFLLPVLLQACGHFLEDDPKYFTRDKAAGAAMTKLVSYADNQGVPVYQFRGPYFMESIGGDFPTYTVCYKHPVHFFCYDHWTGLEHSYKYGVKPKGLMGTWLENQPN